MWMKLGRWVEVVKQAEFAGYPWQQCSVNEKVA